MSYYLAPSLRKLTNEVNSRMSPPSWPTVSAGDGWIGDTSHSARKSDHNPDWSAGGVVRAVDIGINNRNAKAILEAAIGDSRVWYVIHKGIIYSRTYGWAARKYTGANPHNHHIHISIRHGRKWENDTSRWLKPKIRVRPGPVNLDNVREQFFIALGLRKGKLRNLVGIRRIQYGLRNHVDRNVVVDGYVGKQTLNAWGKWERSIGHVGRPRVPDIKTLREFEKKVWAITKIVRKKKK